MSQYGEREKRVSDGGMKRIADLLPLANDEICAILIGIEPLEAKSGNSFDVYRIFSDDGEETLTPTGSNLAKVFEKIAKEKIFDTNAMPMVAIGVERISKYTDKNTGEERIWHNVYVERIKDNDASNRLRMRARQEMKSWGANDGGGNERSFNRDEGGDRGYATAAAAKQAAASRNQSNDLDNVFASEDEIPF